MALILYLNQAEAFRAQERTSLGEGQLLSIRFLQNLVLKQDGPS